MTLTKNTKRLIGYGAFVFIIGVLIVFSYLVKSSFSFSSLVPNWDLSFVSDNFDIAILSLFALAFIGGVTFMTDSYLTYYNKPGMLFYKFAWADTLQGKRDRILTNSDYQKNKFVYKRNIKYPFSDKLNNFTRGLLWTTAVMLFVRFFTTFIYSDALREHVSRGEQLSIWAVIIAWMVVLLFITLFSVQIRRPGALSLNGFMKELFKPELIDELDNSDYELRDIVGKIDGNFGPTSFTNEMTLDGNNYTDPNATFLVTYRLRGHRPMIWKMPPKENNEHKSTSSKIVDFILGEENISWKDAERVEDTSIPKFIVYVVNNQEVKESWSIYTSDNNDAFEEWNDIANDIAKKDYRKK